MQHWETLRRLLDVAASVRDMAIETKTHEFRVTAPITFYLDTEYAGVRFTRHAEPVIRVVTELQAGFGWRLQSEQDEAGVYFVARRRLLVGNLARALFDVTLPAETYIVLKLKQGSVTLDNIQHTLHIPPFTSPTVALIQEQA
jgi:hypothetical protein